jgi:hypothetical protein
MPFHVSLRRAHCAWPQPPTLRPCGPPTLGLAFHTSGAECRSENAFAMQIRRAGLSFQVRHFLSLSLRVLQRQLRPDRVGRSIKKKPLLSTGAFSISASRCVPAGRHRNDYAGGSRPRQISTRIGVVQTMIAPFCGRRRHGRLRCRF